MPAAIAFKPAPARTPSACTTAAAVRQHAVDPALNLVAIEDEERRLREEERPLIARLAVIAKRREALSEARRDNARQIACFTATAAERLEHQERLDLWAPPRFVSELPNWQRIADRVKADLDRLADSSQPRKHGHSRDNLAALFESFPDIFAVEQFKRRVGVNRTLSLKAEHTAWKATQA
jgi:hypothetical protein